MISGRCTEWEAPRPWLVFQAKAMLQTVDLPINMTKLVRKNPIQTHVMTGTFWGQQI